jgi:hypothetical protein
MRTSLPTALLLASLTACGGASHPRPAAVPVTSEPAPPPSEEPVAEAVAPPTLRGNAATNPACALLTLEQVSAASGLDVVGVLGLPADSTNPAKHSESCTWFLDPKVVQSSLVLQYTLYAKPPADLKAYYPQVIQQGFGTAVRGLGDISKVKGHVLDTVYKRAEVHVSLLVHAEATPADQAASVGLMRLVLAGLKQ